MFTWTPEMIRLMQNANARSEYHRQLAAILAPKLAGCRTLCDAGCGLGSLSAALSPYFDAITAADVSDAALDVLRETIRTQNLTNITPLPCDLLQSTDRTRYDGMVFCFFGSLAEILPVARRQCAKTLVIIKKNYELHRFSLTAQPIRGETAPAACEALRAMGIPFTFDTQGSRLPRWTRPCSSSASTARTKHPGPSRPRPSFPACRRPATTRSPTICRRSSGSVF